VKIAIASDHAGYRYKEMLKAALSEREHEVVDFGTDSEVSCDYPKFVHAAAAAVSNGECERGIVLGGSGNGEAITANRHLGVRCALCWSDETARLGRQHNNANMISLGERLITPEEAISILDVWLETPFEGGRHIGRIEAIDQLP